MLLFAFPFLREKKGTVEEVEKEVVDRHEDRVADDDDDDGNNDNDDDEVAAVVEAWFWLTVSRELLGDIDADEEGDPDVFLLFVSGDDMT